MVWGLAGTALDPMRAWSRKRHACAAAGAVISGRAGRKSWVKKSWEEIQLATSNPSREAILARIREGLRTPIQADRNENFRRADICANRESS